MQDKDALRKKHKFNSKQMERVSGVDLHCRRAYCDRCGARSTAGLMVHSMLNQLFNQLGSMLADAAAHQEERRETTYNREQSHSGGGNGRHAAVDIDMSCAREGGSERYTA
jgi:hypothetical protein